jgi:MFS family permease
MTGGTISIKASGPDRHRIFTRQNQQLISLFVCNFVIYFIGAGLMPILPLYAMEFGATATGAGLYMAFIFLSITVGTLLTGWLADRLTRKGLFIGAGLVGIPTLVLLGQATALWQVVSLTAIVWFSAGVGIALVNILTGLSAGDKSRGKLFGLMFLAFPCAAMLAGIVIGQLLAWQGYGLMFAALAVVWAAWPVLGLFWLKDRPASAPGPVVPVSTGGSSPLMRTFTILLVVAVLSETAITIGRLGTSLSMQALNFSPGAIASTTTAGGLVMIPLTLLVGTLSDRLGRKGFLIAGYLLIAGGILMLMLATRLWHFWLASILLFMAMPANGSVAVAFATDLLDQETLSRRLPWLNAMIWIAGIIGFAGAGFIMDTLGTGSLYLGGVALPIVAVILLTMTSYSRSKSGR